MRLLLAHGISRPRRLGIPLDGFNNFYQTDDAYAIAGVG